MDEPLALYVCYSGNNCSPTVLLYTRLNTLPKFDFFLFYSIKFCTNTFCCYIPQPWSQRFRILYIYIYNCWKKSELKSYVHMTWVWSFFNNCSNPPRMCVLSTLCGNVVHFIYIYINKHIHKHMCRFQVWTTTDRGIQYDVRYIIYIITIIIYSDSLWCQYFWRAWHYRIGKATGWHPQQCLTGDMPYCSDKIQYLTDNTRRYALL